MQLKDVMNDMQDALNTYFSAIRTYDAASSTEHTLRGAFESLLNTVAV
jgi:hypothetical protein